MRIGNDKYVKGKHAGEYKQYGLQFNPNGTIELILIHPDGKEVFQKCWPNANIAALRLVALGASGYGTQANLDEFTEAVREGAEAIRLELVKLGELVAESGGVLK